jgi:NAD(P)-dependent dehydrogenase (short-subunit alcohol dehydrogenase family)
MQRGVVFVTGASTGIGKATAERLSRAGFTVIPGVRRVDAVPDGVEPPVRIDMADPDSVTTACAEVLDRAEGRLTGLVNNAGYSVSGPFESLEVDDWRQQFEVNFFGHIAVTKALLPQLLDNRGGIATVGSIGGRFSAPFIAPYNSSKFAVRAWTDGLRHELAPHGVRVSLIEPGAIATPLWEKGNEVADEQLERLTPTQRARYARQISGARKVADFAANHAITTEAVAKVIEHAFTSKRPKGRYLVGADARLQAGVAVLPTVVQDRVTRLLLRQPAPDRG